jgi:hypothetical protein
MNDVRPSRNISRDELHLVTRDGCSVYAELDREHALKLAWDILDLFDQGSPALPTLLKRIVMAYDSDDSLEFLAALRAARKAIGFKLADKEEDAKDVAALKANGYTADGERK